MLGMIKKAGGSFEHDCDKNQALQNGVAKTVTLGYKPHFVYATLGATTYNSCVYIDANGVQQVFEGNSSYICITITDTGFTVVASWGSGTRAFDYFAIK